MFNLGLFFAEEAAPSGIGAFNINLKSFIFQLVTFALVLYVFKRWILPPINKTLEERRKTLEQSLTDAKATEEALANAQTRVSELLADARSQADEALVEAKKAAVVVIAEAESAATGRAALIIKDAQEHLTQERAKLHQELRAELAELVVEATEKVISEKVDAKKDISLIERAIKAVAG